MDQELESQFNEFEKPPVIRRKLLPLSDKDLLCHGL